MFPAIPVTDPTRPDQNLHSIVRGRNDYNLPAPDPIHCEQSSLFWQCRYDVNAGKWPTEYFGSIGVNPDAPMLLRRLGVKETDPSTATALVNHTMDHPLDLHFAFLDEYGPFPELLFKQQDRTPQQAGTDFLGARWLDKKVAEMVNAALVEAFQTKYFFNVARPEHVFGVHCAAYPCPPHPAYPAGHGAIAGAIIQTWLSLVDLPGSVLVEMETIGMHYAHYRTAAGVHWPQDNTAGYRLGASVAERLLA